MYEVWYASNMTSSSFAQQLRTIRSQQSLTQAAAVAKINSAGIALALGTYRRYEKLDGTGAPAAAQQQLVLDALHGKIDLIKETPKRQAPKRTAPKQEAPKQEAPKQEAPKQEDPKQEDPKQETPPESFSINDVLGGLLDNVDVDAIKAAGEEMLGGLRQQAENIQDDPRVQDARVAAKAAEAAIKEKVKQAQRAQAKAAKGKGPAPSPVDFFQIFEIFPNTKPFGFGSVIGNNEDILGDCLKGFIDRLGASCTFATDLLPKRVAAKLDKLYKQETFTPVATIQLELAINAFYTLSKKQQRKLLQQLHKAGFVAKKAYEQGRADRGLAFIKGYRQASTADRGQMVNAVAKAILAQHR